MNIKEKLSILEEMLDIESNMLSEDTVLESLEQWDSIAIISTIAMFDSLFKKEVTSDEVKSFKTVKDITDRMG